jgi:hypothetical protein
MIKPATPKRFRICMCSLLSLKSKLSGSNFKKYRTIIRVGQWFDDFKGGFAAN